MDAVTVVVIIVLGSNSFWIFFAPYYQCRVGGCSAQEKSQESREVDVVVVYSFLFSVVDLHTSLYLLIALGNRDDGCNNKNTLLVVLLLLPCNRAMRYVLAFACNDLLSDHACLMPKGALHV